MDINNSTTPNATGNGVDPVSTSETPAPPTGSTPVATPPSGKARIAIGFLIRDSDPVLIVRSQDILTAMTANKAYPAPNPTLAEFTTARNAYIAAVSGARDSRIGVNVRKQQRENLVVLLRNLAHYVQVASAGDLPTLQGSGFPVQRQRVPVGPLPAPVDLRLSRGSLSGQVIARCRSQAKAGAYQWRCTANATPTAWMPVVTTLGAKTVFDGLVPGAAYTVQVSVIGTAGQSNWSDAATLIVV